MNKGFVDAGRRAYQGLAKKLFGDLKDEWKEKSFIEIDLVSHLPLLPMFTRGLITFPFIKKWWVELNLPEMHEIINKLHSNYVNKTELACLERIVTCYIQTFLVSADKKRLKKEDVIQLFRGNPLALALKLTLSNLVLV